MTQKSIRFKGYQLWNNLPTILKIITKLSCPTFAKKLNHFLCSRMLEQSNMHYINCISLTLWHDCTFFSYFFVSFVYLIINHYYLFFFLHPNEHFIICMCNAVWEAADAPTAPVLETTGHTVFFAASHKKHMKIVLCSFLLMLFFVQFVFLNKNKC